MMTTVPTPIVDRNGKQTTVHKKVDTGSGKNSARVAGVGAPPAKVAVDSDMVLRALNAGNPRGATPNLGDYADESIATMTKALVAALNPEVSDGEEVETYNSETKRAFAIEMTELDSDVFDEHFTPELILEHAGDIYDYMGEHGTDADSVSREALFSYAAEKLGIDYEVVYDKWMAGFTPSY